MLSRRQAPRRGRPSTSTVTWFRQGQHRVWPCQGCLLKSDCSMQGVSRAIRW